MAEFSCGDATNLRLRNQKSSAAEPTQDRDSEKQFSRKSNEASLCNIDRGSYWLTRIVILRYLGFIYSVAFLVAANQNKALLGNNGLLPVSAFLKQVKEQAGGVNIKAITYVPSLLWLVKAEDIDFYLDLVAYIGFVLSSIVMITGAANVITMATLWILYHSIVSVGQRWYSFGWESQLLETGFLAIFLCPVLAWKCLPQETPTSWSVIWGYRWLLFRIMLGAVSRKTDTAFPQTQPVPSPFSYYLHQAPEVYHKFETLSNHFVELIVPWFTFLPRGFRITCGVLQIVFQVALIISGNLSFLNWLTILPSLAFFDDHTLSFMFSSKLGSIKWQIIKLQNKTKQGKLKTGKVRRITNLTLALTVAYLSIPVVVNLMSPHQHMNTSFEPLRIVNTYGAFGSVTKKRTEVIFQGTYSEDPNDPDASWEEYEFKCKPGNITRRPCLITPYHYRLDWLMWFSAFQNYQYNPWLVHLAAKLLVNDEEIMSLLAYNPFQRKMPPRFVRAEHYRYSYTKLGSRDSQRGHWWKRRYIGNYLPPVSLKTLSSVMKRFGWKI
ncbi:lipase maturation factor 1-like [Limulus polyphemus]|uniref:Lipase maturation factor n=1 Tax=Limulus polyphemus TaxID=6850 RepID=A0ABM1S6C2_LIMPO|nr:lipase maturation factor 1-like [Limulus polyphemus]